MKKPQKQQTQRTDRRTPPGTLAALRPDQLERASGGEPITNWAPIINWN